MLRKLSDGGFAEHAGGSIRPDATALCILALNAVDTGNQYIGAARQRLCLEQQQDGRVSISKEQTNAVWPTALAALAWTAAPEFQQSQSRAIRFLLETSGLHWARQKDAPIAHDTSIRGWPWVTGTHSWVEPTALSVLALRAGKEANHPRTREALYMLIDRQLASGGWNYGNTRVFTHNLRPMPDTTGVALQALSGFTDLDTVIKSLEYLESTIKELKTPYSLAWALIGLSAWNRRPKRTEDLVSACLKNESRYGAYPTSHLSLLLLALERSSGMILQRNEVVFE